MKHRGTIALAEELLARGRAGDVARMIDPLLDPDSFPSGGEPGDPGPMHLRILRARLHLLEEGRAEEARALLRPYVEGDLGTGVDRQMQALSRCWMGWATAWEEQDPSVLGEALGHLRSARSTFEAAGRPRRTLWAVLGAAYAHLRLEADQAAGSLLEEARVLTAQVEDRPADQWFDRLTDQHAGSSDLFTRNEALRSAEVRSNGRPATEGGTDAPDAGTRLRTLADRDPALVHVSDPMRTLLRRLIALVNDAHPVLLVGERGTGRRRIARALDRVPSPADSEWTVLEMSPDLPGTGPAGGPGQADEELLPQRLERSLQGESPPGQTVYLHELGGSEPERIERCVARIRELAESSASGIRIIGSVRADQIDETRRSVLARRFPHWIPVPPLRERGPDVPVLARRFLRALQPDHAPPAVLTDRALRTLSRYHWPGNLRQLRNELDRALAYQSAEPAPLIHRSHLAPEIRDGREPTGAEADSSEHRSGTQVDTRLQEHEDLDEALARTERAFIEQVLESHDGHVASAAGRLGLTRQGLYKKMKRLDIERGRFTSEEATAE